MSEIAFRHFWEKVLNALNQAAGGKTEYIVDANGEKKKIRTIAISEDITPQPIKMRLEN
jgi:hypothetical protein